MSRISSSASGTQGPVVQSMDNSYPADKSPIQRIKFIHWIVSVVRSLDSAILRISSGLIYPDEIGPITFYLLDKPHANTHNTSAALQFQSSSNGKHPQKHCLLLGSIVFPFGFLTKFPVFTTVAGSHVNNMINSTDHSYLWFSSFLWGWPACGIFRCFLCAAVASDSVCFYHGRVLNSDHCEDSIHV